MKLNKVKKFFALFFVLIVIIPLTSSLGLWEKLAEAEDAFATGKDAVAEAVDVVTEGAEEGETPNSGSVKYKFSLGIDEDIYDHDAKFTFNGEEYQGVFRNDFKQTEDNMTLKVEDLGTMENPYVVLEVVPEESLSVIRPHVGYLNYFDMTQEEVEAIVLTDYEKTVVRMQLLNQLAYEYSTDDATSGLYNDAKNRVVEIKQIVEVQYRDQILADLIAVDPQYQWNPPADLRLSIVEKYCEIYDSNFPKLNEIVKNLDVENVIETRTDELDVTLNNIEKVFINNGIISEEDYRDYLDIKLYNALEYKRDYYQSISLSNMARNQYPYNVGYNSRYAVNSNGEFEFYNVNDNVSVTTTTETTNHKAFATEIKSENKVLNPLFISGSALVDATTSGPCALVHHKYTFAKGCINMGYNSTRSETGLILSETPYIDEYVFAGWSVKIGDELKNINSLDDDFNLKDAGITQLYTNWVVRYYEQTDYQVLTTGGYVTVDFQGEDSSYIVNLPDCIASHKQNTGYHDYRNQLTMCVARKHKMLNYNAGEEEFRATWGSNLTWSEIAYSEEISSWNFKFKIDDYPTVGDLKKVAPKLMADTDYYVLTKNQVYENGVVTYYPYNVLVITATPEELNKMVYYDSAYNGKDVTVGYKESAYLNKFLDAVDFVFFSNGGAALEFTMAYGDASITDPATATPITVSRNPILNRCPLIYKLNDSGVLEYDKTTVPKSGSYGGDSYEKVVDLEWQVCQKIYQRVAEPKDYAQSGKGQSRSMVVLFDESLGDGVSSKAGEPKCLVDKSGNYINGTADNLAKLMLLFFAYKEPKIMYDWYIDPNYEEEMNGEPIRWSKVTGTVRTTDIEGNAYFPEGTYRGSVFAGSLYGYEKWNAALFFPYEYYEVDHVAAMKQTGDYYTAEVYFYPYSSYPTDDAEAQYNQLGLAKNVNFKTIASPYAYTFNGDNSIASDFFRYHIPFLDNYTNGKEYDGNTILAFEFFRRVNPFKIKDNKLSPKDAIKYMIAASQNEVDIKGKEILILNAAEDKTRFSYGTYTMYVDTIFAEDFNKLAENIEYKFITEESGYYVTEILWTKQYSDYTKSALGEGMWYQRLTRLSDDDPLKWYVMPTALDNADKENYYITYDIETTVSQEDGVDVTTRTLTKNRAVYKYLDASNNLVVTDAPCIQPKSEYYVEALLKPELNDKVWDQRTYMVAVKKYSSYNNYKMSLSYPSTYPPESVVVKPVVIEKLTYLFNLD